MTTAEINDRITKATERISRKEATIARHEKTIAKTVEIIVAEGFAPDATFTEIHAAGNIDAGYAALTIMSLREDIKRAQDEITATRERIAKYEAALEKAAREEAFVIPSAVEELERELVARWDAYDKERRTFLQNAYANDTDPLKRNYRRLHSHEDDLRHNSDETIHADNVRSARIMVKDLLTRVYDITGEVADWEGVHSESGAYCPVLNGFVKGDKGTAKVETIAAGGWNIQKLHVRTLVHEVK